MARKSNTQKVTSPKAAKAASKVLRSGSTGKASKSAAGSALSQKPGSITRKGARPPQSKKR